MLLKKYGIHIVLIIAGALIILVPMLKDKPDPEKLNRATDAAYEFFTLIDAGKFEQARKEGSELLKKKVTLNDWIKQLTNVSEARGAALDRQKTAAVYTTMAVDSPDGEYVIISFISQYEHRKNEEESVVVMIDKNRGWRIAAYSY